MTSFFTSDLHLGHIAILHYCKRPFKTVEEMNDAIIKNWNRVVKEKDTVYLLGDLGMRNKRWELVKWLYSLNGEIHWIVGNHDKKCVKWHEVKKRFASISYYKEININDPEANYKGNKYQKIVLCHYPIYSWNGMHKGAWHLYGHCHGSAYLPHNKILDVGADCWGYTPVSYDQVKRYMKTRKFVRVDGEGKKGDYMTMLDLKYPFEEES